MIPRHSEIRVGHRPLRRLAAPVLIAASGLLVLPVAGWSAGTTAPGNAASDTASPAAPSTGASAPGTRVRGVDGLIAHLHAELKITPAQEPQFQRLADVMREDADQMRTLAKTRAEGAAHMTAVDDLKSYAEISEAHADGAKKMVPAFEALYDSLSDAQKKLADQEFREHYATHHRRAGAPTPS